MEESILVVMLILASIMAFLVAMYILIPTLLNEKEVPTLENTETMEKMGGTMQSGTESSDLTLN